MSIPLADVDTSDILSLWVGELHATEDDTAALAVEGSAPGVRIVEEDARAD